MELEDIGAVGEAAERRCELLSVRYPGAGRTNGHLPEDAAEQLKRELVDLLSMLDSRWDAISRKPSAKIRQDNEWRTLRAGGGELLLASAGEADLFGMTTAAPAAKAFVRLVAASRNQDELNQEARRLPEQAVLAYGAWLSRAALHNEGVRVRLASPTGEWMEAELTEERVQAVHAYISHTAESMERLAVTGKLTYWDAGKRLYRFESRGIEYAGRADRKLKGVLLELDASGKQQPLRAEAVIERRTTYREITDARLAADWLMELDTDLGADPEETLYALDEIASRIRALLESEETDYGGLAVSDEEFGMYAAQLEELRASNPVKGALRLLDRQDAAQAADLLSDGKPIARWVGLLTSSVAATDDMDLAPAARSRLAAQLSRAASAAYPDLMALRSRLNRMTASLRQDAEQRASREDAVPPSGENS